MWSFYKTLFKNPRAVGSPMPSSQRLARAIASFVLLTDGYVVELGAGTGAITKALLRQGVPHHRLIIVENSEVLANELQKKFPQIKVIHGDARHLSTLLGDLPQNIDTIISSLPLLTLPIDVKNDIVREIETLLKPGSHYIQFTHGFVASIFESKKQFKKIKSKNIWLNFPPARIDVFKIEK